MGVRPVLTEGAHLRPAWRPGDTRAEGQLVVGMGAGPSSLACPILSLHSWSVVRVTAKVSTQNLLGASPAPNTSRGRLLCRRICLSRVDRTPFSHKHVGISTQTAPVRTETEARSLLGAGCQSLAD